MRRVLTLYTAFQLFFGLFLFAVSLRMLSRIG